MINRFLSQGQDISRGSQLGAIAFTWGAFMFLGGLPLIAVIAVVALSDPDKAEIYMNNPFDFAALGLPRLVVFVAMMLNFVIGLVGLVFGLILITRQKFQSLLTAWPKVRWTRMLGALALWMVLLGLYSLIQELIAPGTVVLSDDAAEIPFWLLPGLILIPLQSGFEELAVRGQLLQTFARGDQRQPWKAWLITSVLFAMLHGFNMEVSQYGFVAMMLQYLAFGLFLGAFAVMDEGLEIPIGLHIGNNLFSLFCVSYPGASLDTPSLLSQTVTSPTNDLFGSLLLFMLVYLVYFGKRPHMLRMLFVADAPEATQE
jgi:uncharacterized protein